MQKYYKNAWNMSDIFLPNQKRQGNKSVILKKITIGLHKQDYKQITKLLLSTLSTQLSTPKRGKNI